jgi:hypothetical protein
MPAKSKAQQKLMMAAAHNRAFAKKVGVPQSVAKEFIGKSKGGSVNRIGRAVMPSRRDPDIGKMIKQVKVPTKKRRT